MADADARLDALIRYASSRRLLTFSHAMMMRRAFIRPRSRLMLDAAADYLFMRARYLRGIIGRRRALSRPNDERALLIQQTDAVARASALAPPSELYVRRCKQQRRAIGSERSRFAASLAL